MLLWGCGLSTAYWSIAFSSIAVFIVLMEYVFPSLYVSSISQNKSDCFKFCIRPACTIADTGMVTLPILWLAIVLQTLPKAGCKCEWLVQRECLRRRFLSRKPGRTAIFPGSGKLWRNTKKARDVASTNNHLKSSLSLLFHVVLSQIYEFSFGEECISV